MIIIFWYKKLFPRVVRKRIWRIVEYCQYILDGFYIRKYRKQIPILEEKLKTKDQINVVFVTMNLAMWKLTSLFKMMQEHPRFEPVILMTSDIAKNKDAQMSDIKEMSVFFDSLDFPNISAIQDDTTLFDLKKLNPDILFYTQPGKYWLPKSYYAKAFRESLYCYVSYGFTLMESYWIYDLEFHNLLWKFFLPTITTQKTAKKYSRIKAQNTFVSGYPTADNFIEINEIVKSDSLKQLIWAPHHTIQKGDLMEFSTFLENYQIMYELAQEYASSIEFIFKPHPGLKKNLYKYNGWGKEKTDNYYNKWEELSNGRLAEGEYVELFKNSDAMMHDSGSFIAEYLYTKKPVLFLDNRNVEKQLSSFGVEALNCHYKAINKFEIDEFIRKVVLNEEDVMQSIRVDFYNNYLLPPNGRSVAENMFAEIEKYVS